MNFSTYLEKITGVGIYPLISLLIFVVFFLLVVYWMYRIDNVELKRIERLPFDDK
jgi:cytochrome c oxidase cbb3-type subunit 3